MNSTFGRALVGFVILTGAISLMTMVALWGIDTFGGNAWWAGLIVILVALVSVISVYHTTLHEPIQTWIRQPEEDRRNAAAAIKRGTH